MKEWKLNGVLPDTPDERDYILVAAPPVGEELSTWCDLRQFAREIEDQGHVGSCVGNATSSCLELYAKSKLDTDKNFSRLFIYWNARQLGGIVGDEGAYLRDGIKSCNKWGIPEENFWLYDESKVNTQPDETAYQEARKNRVTVYERILNSDRTTIKTTLCEGKSIIMGISLAESFYSISGPLDQQNYTGITDDNEFIGGHAMNIVGYDDNLNGGSYIVENSWGTDWGDQGYFALPYVVFEKDGYDLWACTYLKIDMDEEDPDYVPVEEPPEPILSPEGTIEELIEKAESFFNGPFNKGK